MWKYPPQPQRLRSRRCPLHIPAGHFQANPLFRRELGVQIFIRSGKRVVSVSQPGKEVLKLAERILRDVQNIRKYRQ